MTAGQVPPRRPELPTSFQASKQASPSRAALQDRDDCLVGLGIQIAQEDRPTTGRPGTLPGCESEHFMDGSVTGMAGHREMGDENIDCSPGRVQEGAKNHTRTKAIEDIVPVQNQALDRVLTDGKRERIATPSHRPDGVTRPGAKTA